jgi:hypothetical protein
MMRPREGYFGILNIRIERTFFILQFVIHYKVTQPDQAPSNYQ